MVLHRSAACVVLATLPLACSLSGEAFTLFGASASTGGTTSEGSTSGSSTGSSTDEGSSTTGEASTSEAGGTTVESPKFDLGGAASGGGGDSCSKIDFLFVVSRGGTMIEIQAQLVDAFPTFIETIEAKFADFDYHIMVVEAEEKWGVPVCTGDCPLLDCKIGEPCCPWYNDLEKGDPCCPQDYPCDEVDNLTACDSTMGAGTVTPAGANANGHQT